MNCEYLLIDLSMLFVQLLHSLNILHFPNGVVLNKANQATTMMIVNKSTVKCLILVGLRFIEKWKKKLKRFLLSVCVGLEADIYG